MGWRSQSSMPSLATALTISSGPRPRDQFVDRRPVGDVEIARIDAGDIEVACEDAPHGGAHLARAAEEEKALSAHAPALFDCMKRLMVSAT